MRKLPGKLLGSFFLLLPQILIINMHYINIHTHTKQSDINVKSIRSIEFKDFDFEDSKNELISVGIHPWFIPPKNVEKQLEKLDQICKSSNVIALGECGLDRFFTKDEKEFQRQLYVFNEQCKIANQYSKPLIIHAVNAYSDFLHWLKNDKNQTRLIFHGYNGNEEITNQLLRYNCWFSLGESLLNSKKIQEVFKNTPIENCFLETDESEISIQTIYENAAKLKNMELQELQNKIQINFDKCFTI
jgi:TatD DNase family protein